MSNKNELYIGCPCQEFGAGTAAGSSSSSSSSLQSIVSAIMMTTEDNYDNTTTDDRNSSNNSNTQLKRLIDWLSGNSNNNNNEGSSSSSSICYNCAHRRGKTSLLILNAIRDACRPFFILSEELSSSSSSSSSPRNRDGKKIISPVQIGTTSSSSYEESFPSLTTNAPASNNHNKKTKTKRRIRPATIAPVISSTTTETRNNRTSQIKIRAVGNLSNLPSNNNDEPWVPPVPPIPIPNQQQQWPKKVTAVTTTAVATATTTATTAEATTTTTTTTATATATASRSDASQLLVSETPTKKKVTTTTTTTPPPPPGFAAKMATNNNNNNNNAWLQEEQTTTMPPPKPRPRKPSSNNNIEESNNSYDNETNKEQIMNNVVEIHNLVEVYCTLIQSCLVPSTAMELDLLLYLVCLNTATNTATATTATAASSSPRKVACSSSSANDAVSTSTTSPLQCSSPFSIVLSSPLRCHCFGVLALSKLSFVLRCRMGSGIIQNLLAWQPLRYHCPQLCSELETAVLNNNKQRKDDEEEDGGGGGAKTSSSHNNNTQLKANEHHHEQQQLRIVPISRCRQTALLTLPFKEERDSRHNYQSREGQVVYKNREELRDAFLYQLRAFLNVRGKMVDAAEADRAISNIKRSVRSAVVDRIMDSNLPWFCEFFCEMLLQIGLVPMEETDSDVLKMMAGSNNHSSSTYYNHHNHKQQQQDKLQKLHRRFSSKTPLSSSSLLSSQSRVGTRKLVGNQKELSSSVSCPATDAQKYFPGHQEFFYLFLLSADSYRLGSHLKVRLVSNIKQQLHALSKQEVVISTAGERENQVMELCLFARFLGVLLFSPNWQNSNSINNASTMPTSSCGLKQLDGLGISLVESVKGAWNNGSLVYVVPWVVDLLKLTIWDETTQNAPIYNRLLSLLRQIQLEISIEDSNNEGKMASPSNIIVGLYTETLFGDVVGIAHSAFQEKTTVLDVRSLSKGQESTPDYAIKTYTQSMLFASNSHVEELYDLTSRMAKERIMSLRSPGASRRLRPSAVPSSPAMNAAAAELGSSTNTEPLPWDDANNNRSVFARAADKKESDPIQTKLQEAFFHQHQNLKDVCEYVGSLAIKVAMARIPAECIRPLLEDKLSQHVEVSALSDVTFQACIPFLQNVLGDVVGQSLKALAMPPIDEKVIDIAKSLTVSHAMRSCEGPLKSMVTTELATQQNKLATKAGKRLFENESFPDKEKTSNGSDSWLPDLTTAIKKLNSKLETRGEDISRVPHLIHAVIIGLEAQPQNDPRIPAERELRSFFQSVLLLDRNSLSVIDLALLAKGVGVEVRWSILSGWIRIAIKVKQLSLHGLRTVDRYFSRKESFQLVVDLGLMVKHDENTWCLPQLLVDMVEARMTKAKFLEDFLLTSLEQSHEKFVVLAARCAERIGRLKSLENALAIAET